MLVCDDHALFRRGLEMVLDMEADIEVVGEASDGVEAVQKAQELMPDVILMDVRMPNNRDRGHPAVQGRPAAREDPHADHQRRGGRPLRGDQGRCASGYLLKEISIEEVADAIRSVYAGHSRISPAMASKLLSEFQAMSKATERSQTMPTPELTDREMEVLRLVARG